MLNALDSAAGKVVSKLIFGLRDSLNQDAFRECVAGLEAVTISRIKPAAETVRFWAAYK